MYKTRSHGGEGTLILGTEAEIFPLQKEMNLSEGGPFRLHLGPTLGHQVKDVPRTVVGV